MENINLQNLVDDAVDKLKDIFRQVRKEKVVPLSILRKDVTPLIHEISNNSHLLQIFAALQPKNDYTYRHSIAVGVLANKTGKWMQLSKKELLQLTTAALLHDVGKMSISDAILNKPGKLTAEEKAMMQKHTTYGYEVLNNTYGITERQALVALQHHERMDGSGYPQGLKENEIDLFSRIVAVADVFHAMSSKRVYQDVSPFYRVLWEMERDMFGVLDPKVTLLFIEKTMNSLIGNSVLLTDGREGTILMVPKYNRTRPLIKVDDLFIDLNKDNTLQIEQILN